MSPARTKTKTAAAPEEAANPEEVAMEETTKATANGKRKRNDTKPVETEDLPPKRSLRSKGTPTPMETDTSSKKKVTKAPAKSKKAPVEENGDAKEADVEVKDSSEVKNGSTASKGTSNIKEVAVEHWNAERVKSILEQFCDPAVVFSFNKKANRRGSFEITLVMENGEEEILWSGIKRGPPRKEKFPSDDQVKELAEKYFSS